MDYQIIVPLSNLVRGATVVKCRPLPRLSPLANNLKDVAVVYKNRNGQLAQACASQGVLRLLMLQEICYQSLGFDQA